MLEPLPVKQLLREFNLRPRKNLGQNFLIDEEYLREITDAAAVSKADEVLEIGAGIGSLTRYLAVRAGRLTAVEIDRNLFPLLERVLDGYKYVKLVQGDIMELDPAFLVVSAGYKVVANIPYYLTSNLIRRLLESNLRPSMLALTVQKEVAERVCAESGEMSLLSLSVQLYGQPRIAMHIPASAFYPVPNVDSALLIVDLFDEARIPVETRRAFFALAKSAFSQKRKMLHNSLTAAPQIGNEEAAELLEEAGIDGKRRPQTLTLDEWAVLSRLYHSLLD
jgi:16S rRNA (adenine1518-N6/adenine1519-N6)-dimethyltransferase